MKILVKSHDAGPKCALSWFHQDSPPRPWLHSRRLTAAEAPQSPPRSHPHRRFGPTNVTKILGAAAAKRRGHSQISNTPPVLNQSQLRVCVPAGERTMMCWVVFCCVEGKRNKRVSAHRSTTNRARIVYGGDEARNERARRRQISERSVPPNTQNLRASPCGGPVSRTSLRSSSHAPAGTDNRFIVLPLCAEYACMETFYGVLRIGHLPKRKRCW